MGKSIFIGVDLGGTKILTGAIDSEGNVLGMPIRMLTGGTDPAEEILHRITGSINDVIKNLNASPDDIAGIGIGATGPVDIENGLILECPQLPTMHFYPLRREIENFFGLPVFFNNDANCLIYAETVFGAAAGKRNVVGFTLGTGLGCAIVLGRKLVNGSTGTAAEVWTSPYRSGIIEDYVSGQGVSRIYKILSGLDRTSLEIFRLAETGDDLALKAWKEFGSHLAFPVAWTVNLIDPEIVVLGGSISAAFPFFKDTMEENLRKWICPVPAENTRVVTAKLGDNGGFTGAACLVIENLKNN